MTLRLLPALILVLGLTAPAARPQELEPADAQRIRGLCRELDAEAPEARNAAQTALEAYGDRARPILLAALDEAGPEGRLRLQSILEGLPGNEVEAAAPYEGTLVDIEVEEKTAEEVIGLLERRAGFTFQRPFEFDADRRFSFSLRQVPALMALDRLADAAGLRWFHDPALGSIRWTRGTAGSPYLAYDGPFRVALAGITRNATLTFGDVKRESSWLQAELVAEPRCELVGVWLPPVMDRIVDDQGRSLASEQEVRSYLNPAGLRRSFVSSLPFIAPPREAKAIAEVSGHFEVAIADRFEEITLRAVVDEDKSALARRGRLEARITAIVDTPEGSTLTVEMVRDPLWADAQRNRPLFEQAFDLIDAAGHPLSIDPAIGRQQRGDVEVFTLKAKGKDADHLVIRSMKSFRKRKVAFLFRDLPLP